MKGLSRWQLVMYIVEVVGWSVTSLFSTNTAISEANNAAQNTTDNFPSYPPDNHHCSDYVHLREGDIVEVIISRKRCTMKTLLLQTTNRK